MTWLALGAIALTLAAWWGRRRGGAWRPAGAVLATVALVGAAVAGVRQEWVLCALLLAAGATLALSARRR